MSVVLTDERIAELIAMPKRVRNAAARKVQKLGHEQANYVASSMDEENDFQIFLRQNQSVKNDFSCGLNWRSPSGETIILLRYNGSNHIHPNRIEKTKIYFQFHIHRATEAYMISRRDADGFAEATTRYRNLNEAFLCLIQDCNVLGITPVEEREWDLFSGN